jgi:hypothetical protein
MKIGYSYWGYLGDVKYEDGGNIASTPDGNAFYSWSIIKELQNRGNEVIQIMPDRDAAGYKIHKEELFRSWCSFDRFKAYTNMIKIYNTMLDFASMTKEELFSIWDKNKLNECSIILHEWRMEIDGRNDLKTKSLAAKGDVRCYQPDLFIQECLFEYCKKYNIPVIIFDLDYKISLDMIYDIADNYAYDINHLYLFELGYKWKAWPNAFHVEIPFDFSHINDLDVDCFKTNTKNLVYIGNRYERDWCIDKYIPTEINGVKVFGNWNESGRDSKERWPNIDFGSRLQTKDMLYEYNTSLCTILLAKEEYLKYSFMTARIIEAIFYGCIPLFIEEYGEECIKKYAGDLANDLTVHSKADVIDLIYHFKEHKDTRKEYIKYLRRHLNFMDVKNFVNKIEEVLIEEDKR